MAGALHDLQGLVAADGAPRDAGRAQVVERDRLPRRVADHEQLGTIDTGEREAAPELHRELLVGRVGGDHAALAARLLVHRFQEREQLAVDRDAARALALRRRDLPGASVGAGVHEDDPALEIDVSPFERTDLTGAEIEVRRHGEEPAPIELDGRAREELRRLRGVQVCLRLRVAAVRPVDVLRRVVDARAEVAAFRVRCVGEHDRHEPPDVLRGLPRERARLHLAVESVDDALEVLGGYGRDRDRADEVAHVVRVAAAVVAHRGDAARLSDDEPAIDPLVHDLTALDRHGADLASALHDEQRGLARALAALAEVPFLDRAARLTHARRDPRHRDRHPPVSRRHASFPNVLRRVPTRRACRDASHRYYPSFVVVRSGASSRSRRSCSLSATMARRASPSRPTMR